MGSPNYARALQQHELYCAALEKCGLTLTRLEADQRYPDATFVEDVAVLIQALPYYPTTGGLPERRAQGRASAIESSEQKPAREPGLAPAEVPKPRRALTNGRTSGAATSALGAILTRPGAASRVGEVEGIAEVLSWFYSELHSIQAPGTVDGGDVCEAENHFFIGISARTNEVGARQLAKLLALHGCTASCVDIRGVKDILHLKSGLAYLGDNRLAVIEVLAERAEFQSYDLVRLNAAEDYAANCVRVNNRVLVAAGYPGFESTLRALGYETIAVEMTEFQKMDGGLSCLSLRF